MKAKLISRDHGEFAFSEQATIGRREGSTVTLDVSVVSTEHAKITFDPERPGYVLEDLGSLNGTELDGIPVERPEPLGRLHLICFGGSEKFMFQELNTEDVGELDTIEVPPVGQTQVGAEVPVLPVALRDGRPDSSTVSEGEAAERAESRGTRVEEKAVPLPSALQDAGPSGGSAGFALEFSLEDGLRRFELQEGNNVVGRSKTADIRLDVRDLSRQHAVISVSGARVSIRDEGSRNHTFVDGDQIEDEVEVAAGSRIVFGRLESRVIAVPGAEEEKA